ncbi:acyl-CoA--sterol O-acyltransferase 1-like [Chenopodium quinoa]|uniref:acyl-CoA--sterol O-acyltransferase 1-like n=1 Tax=Chenopodium quinoa TaxID=63459 RepID=UPI000B778E86|nr:acyl-CoA--sterol O-acyltransferase 1-like [Chenopodium quinoa]
MLSEGANPSYSDSSSPISLLLLLLMSYGYCYFFVTKLPKGVPRLISLVGVFYVLFVAPWYFPSSISLRGIASFFLSWISSFKLLLFSFGKGDLILFDSYVNFVVVAVFPFKVRNEAISIPCFVKKGTDEKDQMYTTLFSDNNYLFSGNVLQIIALAMSISIFALSLRDGMILLLSLIIVVHQMLPHVEPIPILKQPNRATSLQNFWGRRWNRVSSDILRHTIYNPARKLLDVYFGVGPGQVVALVITLVVSGIMHQIMFYHMTCGMKPTWEVTKFFVLQGIFMAIELLVKRFWENCRDRM